MDSNILNQKLLLETFEYKEGHLYWKKTMSNFVKAGTKAGSLDSYGYENVGFLGKDHKIHRLIFMMHYGYLPTLIDHKDNNPLNNKIENLRPATKSQNALNSKINSKNTSGVKNVYWSKHHKKWHVRVIKHKKLKHIGYFENLELADLVAQEARNKYHGEFACHE